MPLSVVSFSTYLTTVEGLTWRPHDYDARDFVHAIKDFDIAGFAFVRRRDTWHQFENASRHEVLDWFAEMVADHFERSPLGGPFALVPVPGSKADLGFEGTPRTAVIAMVVAGQLASARGVRDVLRWDAPSPAARLAGGVRDAAWLYDKLHLTAPMRGERVVLIDDVVTTGGHLRACTAKLRSDGAEVLLAICAGRADSAQVADPFAVRSEELDDFWPSEGAQSR
jgi:hypothetical protein